jgi:hypothetical protein
VSISVRGFNDLERDNIAHLFDFRSAKFSSDEALHGVQRVRGICNRLALCDLPDESLVFVSEADNRWRGAAAFFVRDDLHGSVLEHGNTAVGCA